MSIVLAILCKFEHVAKVTTTCGVGTWEKTYSTIAY